MKKERLKVVLEYILQELEMRNTYCTSLYLCLIANSLLYDVISFHEYEEITEYIISNRPKFGSVLMDKDLRKSYRKERKMTAKEYNDEKFKPNVIWESGNYIQRKMWLLLHIKKNS